VCEFQHTTASEHIDTQGYPWKLIQLLQGHDKEDIISVFIEHVVKTEEEVEEKETRGGKTTDLKLYLLDNQGFEFGTIETTVEHLATSDDTDRNTKIGLPTMSSTNNPLMTTFRSSRSQLLMQGEQTISSLSEVMATSGF